MTEKLKHPAQTVYDTLLAYVPCMNNQDWEKKVLGVLIIKAILLSHKHAANKWLQIRAIDT